MLDLNKLSQKLDEALEKETPESLMQWLMSKRASAVNEYIGAGNYLPLNVNKYSESIGFACLPDLIGEGATPSSNNTQYAMAA